MNVYDFDGTVYRGDSTADLYFFCLRRTPGMLKLLPSLTAAFVKYRAGRIDKTEFKEVMYRFLTLQGNVEKTVTLFWKTHRKNLKQWYLEQKCPDDLIISASPEFLLRPICEELGIALIASQVDPKTGKHTGKNCRDEEKVRRFYEKFPDGVIDEFYSDSHADDPLAKIAKKAFFVRGDRRLPWKF